ncbi:MAG: MFS transporter [Phycisphaerae bacterium]|jgi:MFS family permease
MSHTQPDTGVSSTAAPRPGLLLAGHVVYMFLHSILFANVLWLVPLLVRLRFGAADNDDRDWQTMLVTAALPTFMMSSIFWAELLRRVTLRRYLVIFWLSAALPLGCIGFVHGYWALLLCHVAGAAGYAGWTPLNGRLLKHFYADAVRGRMFAVLNLATLVGSVLAIYVVGRWLEADPEAFRIYFPAATAVQLAGIVLLWQLVRRTQADHDVLAEPPRSWKVLLEPVWHMRRVLRADRAFLRYEIAFMTYGAAYMICDALLPVLATDRLGMRYEDYAHSTLMVTKLATLLCTLPAGFLLDRFGPIRTSALSFAVLAAYPLMLLAAGGPGGVAAASVVWGVGLGGVMFGWTLGPVTLAGTSEKVPQYAAIHATLVGVRGVLFEGLGMGIYKLTGSFVWPLLLAAVGFMWGALQMRRLHADLGHPAGGSTPSRAIASKSWCCVVWMRGVWVVLCLLGLRQSRPLGRVTVHWIGEASPTTSTSLLKGAATWKLEPTLACCAIFAILRTRVWIGPNGTPSTIS